MCDTKLDQALHCRDGLRQNLERVLADIEVTQSLKPSKRARQCRKLIVVQVKEIAKSFQAPDTIRQFIQFVMLEVEHSQIVKVADTFRDLGQPVVSQNKRLQVSPAPYLFGYGVQPLPPK